MGKRAVYQKNMEARLKELSEEIYKLKAKADIAVAETKFAYYENINSLLSKQESVHANLKELVESGDSAWEGLKEGMDQSWNQVKDAYNKAAARFN